MTLDIRFVIQDVWIGVYWKIEKVYPYKFIDIYICIIPMFPIHYHNYYRIQE